MLSVENVNLHYGAAQALRNVSITAEMGKITHTRAKVCCGPHAAPHVA